MSNLGQPPLFSISAPFMATNAVISWRYVRRRFSQFHAERAAREIVNQRSEVVIHRSNGEIRDKNSYGKDPFPPKR